MRSDLLGELEERCLLTVVLVATVRFSRSRTFQLGNSTITRPARERSTSTAVSPSLPAPNFFSLATGSRATLTRSGESRPITGRNWRNYCAIRRQRARTLSGMSLHNVDHACGC